MQTALTLEPWNAAEVLEVSKKIGMPFGAFDRPLGMICNASPEGFGAKLLPASAQPFFS
jgi:hypothetical protein